MRIFQAAECISNSKKLAAMHWISLHNWPVLYMAITGPRSKQDVACKGVNTLQRPERRWQQLRLGLMTFVAVLSWSRIII